MNRRKFVRKSSLTIGALGLGAHRLISLDRQSKPIRIGVIGTGSRGQGLQALISEIDGLQVTACCDVIPFRLADGLAMTDGRAKGYEDYRELLDDRNVDAVIISTPFSMHGHMALDVLDAGKHLYCEKTMVRGISEIRKVIQKAKESPQLIFQTGHQYHSSELYRKVNQIIASGYIGEVTAFHCQWNRNDNWRRPVPDPKWERLINWRMYREYSGGLVAELMSHQIDFINWNQQAYPALISGFGGIDHWKDGRETYDNIHLLIAYSNGVDASFSCTTTNGFEDYEIRILGSKATIILDYVSAKIYLEQREPSKLGLVDGVSGATIQAWNRGEGATIDANGEDPTKAALMEFRDCIRTGRIPESNVFTGGITAKCVDIALEAVQSNTTRKWEEYPGW